MKTYKPKTYNIERLKNYLNKIHITKKTKILNSSTDG